ncbi:hypothetical protein H4I96_12353, partial [Botrytis cinerea]
MPSFRNLGGRPRKYATAAEARKANTLNNSLRKKRKALPPSNSMEFIVFKASAFANVSSNTPPLTGMRMAAQISQDQILQAQNVCESSALERPQTDSPPQAQLPLVDNNKEIDTQKVQIDTQESTLEEEESDLNIARILMELRSSSTPPLSTSSQIELTAELQEQMRQIRLEEEEADEEYNEYETTISDQMKETNLATGSTEAVIQLVNTINRTQEPKVKRDPSEDRISDHSKTREPQTLADGGDLVNDTESLYIAPLDEATATATSNNDNAVVSNSRHPSMSTQGSASNPILLSSPIQPRSPSFQLSNQSRSQLSSSRGRTRSRSQQSSRTGRTRFLVQSNLEAWLTPSPRPTSAAQHTTPSPSLLQYPTNTSSSTRSQNESIPPSTPFESPIPSTPAFTNPEFAPSSASTANPSPAPSAISTPMERTAIKLAKQLRNFQGCTHEQHRAAEQLHREYHQEPDIHSECSSLQDITTLLKGDYPGGVLLPDVLSNHKIAPGRRLQFPGFQAAFEGVSTTAAPEDDGTRNENL